MATKGRFGWILAKLTWPGQPEVGPQHLPKVTYPAPKEIDFTGRKSSRPPNLKLLVTYIQIPIYYSTLVQMNVSYLESFCTQDRIRFYIFSHQEHFANSYGKMKCYCSAFACRSHHALARVLAAGLPCIDDVWIVTEQIVRFQLSQNKLFVSTGYTLLQFMTLVTRVRWEDSKDLES